VSQNLYDPIRRRSLAATPEEIIRQSLLQKMIRDLGFPRGLIAVEKELGAYRRRFDIVCYASAIHPDHALHPLLVIECKALECSEAAREQAFGYNATLGAPFICIAGKTEIHTLWLNADKIMSVPFLPPYSELLEIAKKHAANSNSRKE
jgi:hypothetical protein